MAIGIFLFGFLISPEKLAKAVKPSQEKIAIAIAMKNAVIPFGNNGSIFAGETLGMPPKPMISIVKISITTITPSMKVISLMSKRFRIQNPPNMINAINTVFASGKYKRMKAAAPYAFKQFAAAMATTAPAAITNDTEGEIYLETAMNGPPVTGNTPESCIIAIPQSIVGMDAKAYARNTLGPAIPAMVGTITNTLDPIMNPTVRITAPNRPIFLFFVFMISSNSYLFSLLR